MSDAPPDAAPGSRRFAYWNLGALAVAALATLVGVLRGTPGAVVHDFYLAPPWDDGRAEVATFGSGLTVTTFRELDAVKTVWRDAAPEQRTVAVRVARADPARVLEASLGAQGPWGNTFALVVPRAGALVWHDHPSEREGRLPPGSWLEDQLAVTLRALPLEPGWALEVPVAPSLAGECPPPAERSRGTIVRARLRVMGDESITTGLGALLCARVKVDGPGLDAEIWIGRDGARPIARFRGLGGRSGVLRSLERVVAAPSPRREATPRSGGERAGVSGPTRHPGPP